MKNQELKNRKEQPFYASEKNLTFVMGLGGKVKTLWLILYGTLTVAAGGGVAGTSTLPECPVLGLIKRVRVRTSSTDGRYPDGVIRDLGPRELLWRGLQQRDSKMMIGDIGATPLTGGGAGAYAVYAALPIFFADYNLRRPIESALNVDASANKLYQVEIDTQGWTDAFTGATTVPDYTGLKLAVMDDRESVDGDTYVVLEDSHDMFGWATEQQRLQDPSFWSAGDGALMDMMLLAKLATGVMSDTILSEVTLTGANVDLYMKERDIVQAMYDDGMIATDEYVNRLTGGTLKRDGFYLINFTKDGLAVSKAVPAQSIDAKFHVLAPSGGGDVLTLCARRMLQPANFKPIQFGQKGRNQ